MKKILLTLIALVMSIGISWAADKTVYLNPGPWNVDGAVYSIWVFGATNTSENPDKFVAMTAVDGTPYYQVTVPEAYTKIIFVRQNPNGDLSDWSSKWNQTDNIETFTDKSLFTITGWNQSDFSYNSYFIRTIPTEPTAYKKKVVIVYSNYFDLGLYLGLYNSGWGSAYATWSAIEEMPITNERNILHVTGRGFAHRLTKSSGRTSDKWVTLDGNTKYTQVHVSVYPKTATTLHIYKDGGWDATDMISVDVTPGQWNVITADVPSTWDKNFYCVTLNKNEDFETEFYLDDFYFTNADSYVEPVEQTLSSITMPNYIFPAATGQNFNVSPMDANDDDYEENVTYGITAVSSGADAGSLGTVINGNNIVFGAGGVAGIYRLTGTDENSNSATHDFALVSTGPVAPTADADDVHALYCETYGATEYGGWNPGWEWGYGSRDEITIGGVKCLRIHNLGTHGIPYTADDLTAYKYLKFDVYTVNAESNCHVKIERTNKSNLTFTTNAGVWTTVTIDLEGLEMAVDGNRWVDFYFGVDNTDRDRDVLISNVYFLKDTAPAEKTVTFVNDGEWDKVFVQVYDSEWNVLEDTEITGTLTFETDNQDVCYIQFHDDSWAHQSDSFGFVDGATYNSQGIPAAMGYYIVGSMTDTWKVQSSYKMTLNETAAPTVEYYINPLALTTTDQFKVAYSPDGVLSKIWYPSGSGNNYGENGEITANGNYVIFFRPNADGGADWFYNVIYVTSMIDAGEDPTTGAHILTGVWDADKFASIDAMDKAAAYDLTQLSFTGQLDMIGKTANPYCMFITSAPGKVNRNEVVWDEANSRYNGFAMYFAEPADATAPFDINTSIAPIHVVNPFFQRMFTSANNYFTMTIPFDYTLPETDKAWTMSATSSESGLSVTFTEVAAGSTLTKNTPYLYFSSVGGVTMPDPGEVIIDWAAQTVAETDASFVANYSRKVTDGTENIYVLPGVVKETALQFQKAGEVSIRPFRAYLQAASAPAKINVMFDDATGIHAATAEQLEGIFNIYSIDGKLVRQNSDKMGLNKGVYIINGKKVVVK